MLPELVAEAAFAHAEKPGNVGVDQAPEFATGPAPGARSNNYYYQAAGERQLALRKDPVGVLVKSQYE